MIIRKQYTFDNNYTITESSLLEIRAVMAEVVDSHNRREVVHNDTRRNAEKIKNAIADATAPYKE